VLLELEEFLGAGDSFSVDVVDRLPDDALLGSSSCPLWDGGNLDRA
jgi:hypothetical protein